MKFGEWTPTEQTPPVPTHATGDKYLATVSNKHVIGVRYIKTIVKGKEILRWRTCSGDKICPWDILAYMPYPEAY